MAARRGGGLIKQELTAAYGMDQSKANFLLELGLVDDGYQHHTIYPNMAYCWKPLD